MGHAAVMGGEGKWVVDECGCPHAGTVRHRQDEPLPPWRLTLQQPSRPWRIGRRRELSPSAPPVVQTLAADTIRLTWKGASDAEGNVGVCVVLEIRGGASTTAAAELRWQVSVDDPCLIIRQFRVVAAVVDFATDTGLMWPKGLGQRLVGDALRETRWLTYPSGNGTMPWIAVDHGGHGHYLGVHDRNWSALDFGCEPAEGADLLRFTVGFHPFVDGGKVWRSPPVILRSYAGTWHEAASFYRRWFDDTASVLSPPAWVQEATGWLLAILKQQNGQVLFDYRSGIDRLADVAIDHGLDVLGLFGWAHGGHDYLYPDYLPDPLMGGRDALTAAIARAKARGVRVVLYANGQLIDTRTDFFRYQGNDAAAFREDRELHTLSIRKFHSSTPVTFAMADHASAVWRERMRDLAVQAQQLGAGGLLYDQLGVSGPYEAFGNEQVNPLDATVSYRLSMLQEIQRHMTAVDPQFVVATEGVIDRLSTCVGFFHGWGTGFSRPQVDQHMFATDAAEPAMFRFTFPEPVLTQRHATPVLDRATVHYALLHGMRHEIEARYRPDVRYLLDGTVPTAADYADCAYYPPDHAMMARTAQAEAAAYLAAVNAFKRRNANLLLHGRFRDTIGFTVQGAGILARAFENGDALGILVCNDSDEHRPVALDVPEARLINVDAPTDGNRDPAAPLPAHSTRLYCYRRSHV